MIREKKVKNRMNNDISSLPDGVKVSTAFYPVVVTDGLIINRNTRKNCE